MLTGTVWYCAKLRFISAGLTLMHLSTYEIVIYQKKLQEQNGTKMLPLGVVPGVGKYINTCGINNMCHI